MTSPYFSKVERWRFPESAIADCLSEMAIDGRLGNEGIVLFLGRDQGTTTDITHLVKLRGSGIQKFPGLINISPGLLNHVADVAIDLMVRLVGQVHSHGHKHFLDLSPTDRAYGIQAPYFLSLVAPDYGLSTTPIHSWGIHVFMEGEGYVRVAPAEAIQSIEVISDRSLPFITVGGEDE